jgi:hypothetical protein
MARWNIRMYREAMKGHEGFTDISELGVCCRVCHKWSNGQSDSCSHCRKRLLGQRPLSPRSVEDWVEDQIEEHDALGIPVLNDDDVLLRRWAAFDPENPGTEQDVAEAATYPLDDVATRLSTTSPPMAGSETSKTEHVRQLMAEHDLTWREALKLSERDFDDEDVARIHRYRPRPWRIAVAVSGVLFLTMFGLLEWLWRTTEGDISKRNAFGALAVLFALPMLGLFVAVEASLIGLGINTKIRLERIASWSGAALLLIWLGWTLVQS